MDRFVGMAVYAKVVESGSFAAAARHFRLSPAMASKHVKTIEDRLGVRLLNRTTRRVSATEVGRDYYERCVRILAALNDADRAAGDLQTAPRGLLKVSAPFTFGIGNLTPAIADYLSAYPDVAIDLVLNDRYVDLIEEGFDLAIRIGRLPDSSLIVRKLTSMHTVLCASPDYLERCGIPETPADLAIHNRLGYTYSRTQGEWRFTGPDGEDEVVPIAGSFMANNGDVLRTMALRGVGIVRAPSYIVGDDIAAGRLVHLLPGFAGPETPVHAVYPHSRHLSAKARSFIDFLDRHFAGQRTAATNPVKRNGDGSELFQQVTAL
jgi:DNA-binding transcriptional LysR family regulator